ncbi:MAG: HDIG domain-containing metalloprotein [bacterium]
MTRETAFILLNEKIQTQNLIKHCLAVEAGMKEVATYFGEDEEFWGLTGLLHDLDYEDTKNDFSQHGIKTAEILQDCVPEFVLYAIKAHASKVPAKSKMDYTLYAIDPLTGLIVASALMHPDKKLQSITVEFILRRFEERRFAAGANREQIKECEKLGLSLEQFIGLTLAGMQKINADLGL